MWRQFIMENLAPKKKREHGDVEPQPDQRNRRKMCQKTQKRKMRAHANHRVLRVPVTDIAEPTFAEVATAIKYGIGGISSRSVTASTIGVKIRQIVSFTKNAARIPEASNS